MNQSKTCLWYTLLGAKLPNLKTTNISSYTVSHLCPRSPVTQASMESQSMLQESAHCCAMSRSCDSSWESMQWRNGQKRDLQGEDTHCSNGLSDKNIINKRLSVTNLRSENNLPTLQLNAPVVIRVKVKRCEQMLLFIAMHYWGYMSSYFPSSSWITFSSFMQKPTEKPLKEHYNSLLLSSQVCRPSETLNVSGPPPYPRLSYT